MMLVSINQSTTAVAIVNSLARFLGSTIQIFLHILLLIFLGFLRDKEHRGSKRDYGHDTQRPPQPLHYIPHDGDADLHLANDAI